MLTNLEMQPSLYSSYNSAGQKVVPVGDLALATDCTWEGLELRRVIHTSLVVMIKIRVILLHCMKTWCW